MDLKKLIEARFLLWQTLKKQQKSLLIASFAIGVFFLVLLFQKLFLTSSEMQVSPDKSWEISVRYDRKTKTITIPSLKLVALSTKLDDRPSVYSPYRLLVFDDSGKPVYTLHVPVVEETLVDFITNQIFSVPRLPETIPSELFIPYSPKAVRLEIQRNGKPLLRMQFPKTLAFQFAEPAFAQNTASQACGPLQVVFINDNYPDENEFRADVQTLKNLYNSTPPYNVTPSIFDFKEIDTPQQYNCGNDLTSCIYRIAVPAQIAALRAFPGAQKVIVITSSATPDVQKVGGVASLGGPVVLYSNYPYYNGQKFFSATHEFLGHAVGFLHDRYVINPQFAAQMGQPNYGALQPGEPRNNCTDNPRGEAGWPGSYQGCANHSNFAPYPLTCDWTNQANRAVDNGGNYSTIMSALTCAATRGFDSVEQNWVRTHIVSQFQTTCPTPSLSPSPSPSLSPSVSVPVSPSMLPLISPSALLPTAHSLQVTVFHDSNNNQVQDAGEQGYSAVSVQLAGPVTATKITDGNGIVSFDNIPDGSYTIQISIAATSSQPEPLTIGAASPAVIPLRIGVYIPPSPTPIPGISTILTPTPKIAILTPTPLTSVLTPTLTTGINQPNSLNSSSTTDDSNQPLLVYNCVPDPSCTSGKKNLQLCSLICTTPTPSPSPAPYVPPVTAQPVVVTQQPTAAQTQPISFPPIVSVQPTPVIPGQIYIACEDDFTFQLSGSIDLSGIAAGGVSAAPVVLCKPVVYLYPKKPIYVTVTLQQGDTVALSNPLYGENGWQHVLAFPDGTLQYQGKTYTELFYELQTDLRSYSPQTGILIPKSQLGQQLLSAAQKLGLQNQEAKEFADFWTQKLIRQKGNYVLFSLVDNQVKQHIDDLIISPKPDTFLAFTAFFQMLNFPAGISPLHFPDVPARKGFTAVEWGGIARGSQTIF